MTVKVCKIFSAVFFSAFLLIAPVYSQQTNGTSSIDSCPNDQPGIYVKDATGWQKLAPIQPAKMKAKHAFLSSMSYGAVAAPMVVEYAEAHAQIQIHAMRPFVCVSHVMFSGSPLLVRLEVKKKTRELDSGSVRAIPFANDSRQGQASANSVVPTTTSTEDGKTILEPQIDLSAGEYAVMFGAQNLAIFDFGANAPK